jgi:glycosyltransferase involved in cell wall biosynthesis
VKPEISVVVPTHNRRELLQLTLRAVLSQRDVDFEVVVVDDGSTDDIAAGTAELEDSRVRMIRHDRPLGVSTARNHGAEQAAGAWLAFCDDDDLWAPDKLARQLAAASETGCAWSYGGAVRIDSTLRIISGTPPPVPQELARRMPRWNVMPGGASNAIVRADAFRAAGGWDSDLVNLADWDLWTRFARNGPPACVAAPLVGYRIHNGNASGNTALILREARALDGRYGVRLDYGQLHHYLAWVCLRSGRRRPAMAHLARAAAFGQVRGVGKSVMGLVAARASRRLPALRPARDVQQNAWYAEAEAWIAPFRELPRRSSSCT